MKSSAAIQFNPAFTMSNRSSFTWPGSSIGAQEVIDHSQGLVPTGYETSLTPSSGSRSITSSPPRGPGLTTKQRSERKQVYRAQRAGNSPHMQPPLVGVGTEGSPQMPIYSTAPPPMTMLTSPPTTMAPQYSYTDSSQPALYSYGAHPV